MCSSVLFANNFFFYHTLCKTIKYFTYEYLNEFSTIGKAPAIPKLVKHLKNQVTDDEAVGENAQLGNSRRNPRPRYKRRLVRRPRATSSQQTNTVENLPSADAKRKSPNPASSPVTSLRVQTTDIPPESCNKSTKV